MPGLRHGGVIFSGRRVRLGDGLNGKDRKPQDLSERRSYDLGGLNDIFTPTYLGNLIENLTSIFFEVGWFNHQLVTVEHIEIVDLLLCLAVTNAFETLFGHYW